MEMKMYILLSFFNAVIFAIKLTSAEKEPVEVDVIKTVASSDISKVSYNNGYLIITRICTLETRSSQEWRRRELLIGLVFAHVYSDLESLDTAPIYLTYWSVFLYNTHDHNVCLQPIAKNFIL